MVATHWDLNVFADFHGFLVADLGADWASLSEQTSDDTIASMFIQGDGWVHIGTARNMTVPAAISVLDGPPGPAPPDVHRMNEGRLDLRSGVLTVFGVSEYAPDYQRIQMPSGTYRVRALYRNLDRISLDGLEGEDAYEVQLWPESTHVTLPDAD